MIGFLGWLSPRRIAILAVVLLISFLSVRGVMFFNDYVNLKQQVFTQSIQIQSQAAEIEFNKVAARLAEEAAALAVIELETAHQRAEELSRLRREALTVDDSQDGPVAPVLEDILENFR